MGQIDSDLSGQTIDTRYRVVRRIGAGGMGTVWLAQHVQTLQHFAIKTLRVSDEVPDTAMQRCLKEARAAAALRSRHVVRITDVQPDYRLGNTPLPYIVMELLEGVDFESLLGRRKTLTPAEVAWVLMQTCRGMQTAHDNGIVHRDLKPANLFLASDEDGAPVVKICDFGLAKAAPVTQGSNGMTTETGVILGTPRYMAPEQLRDSKRVSTATDQWAIGLIAYRMLAGHDYFEGTANPVELSLRIVHDELRLPSRSSALIAPQFDAWFVRSCDRDPERRYRSIQAQAEALVEVLGAPIPITLGEFPNDDTSPHPKASQARVEPVAATVASEADGPPRTARQLYVALGVAAAIGILGTSTLGAMRPFAWQQTAAANNPTAMAGSTQEQRSRAVPPESLQTTASASVEPAAMAAAGRHTVVQRRPNKSMVTGTPAAANTSKPSSTTSTASQRSVSGASCSRSSECESQLCVAERCR